MGGNSGRSHYVFIDEELCNGCILCMKACPTKAIRVKEGVTARIESLCIYCGECIRVCPRRAIRAVTSGDNISELGPCSIIGVSPVFYAQFVENFTPNEILLALRRTFKFVYDLGYFNELCNLATELYIKAYHHKEGAKWPLISPNCPVVNRIIAHRFHSLLDNILPIITPRELAAKYFRQQLLLEGISGIVGIYSLTSCPAEMISIREPIFIRESYMDGAIGFNDAFGITKNNIRESDEDSGLHRSSGIGMGWGISGGEIAGLDSGKYLAVSGIPEIIRYLEKIEMGLLGDIEYVEFRACPEGCIGGPMSVIDRYQAKYMLQRLMRIFGAIKKVRFDENQKAYRDGWFFSNRKRFLDSMNKKNLSFHEAFERQERVNNIAQRLPGKECGACGSPDCDTFAQDVVDGKNSIERCVFLKSSN